ncbi:peptidoglycan DD-metalloendopeptidase family protein [Tissierella sp. MSJ-40]|uniref:Peptidoglycan DD-metalloendopeptidase family protein n=1 Tax=Tissierella simiarum TaxID=2841534 RepID=A0ABS6E6Z3_9FIRM|nr:M23 family metallopeptidase [Tissierella simiarum]MBU5437993.1 peptidoglycan DD-metalloendopeptidase family protein [Tissierella simiarum]
MDEPNRLELKIIVAKERIANLINDIKNHKLKNINLKNSLIGFMLLVIVGLGITGYKINEIRTRAFDVYFGNNKVGTIRQQEEALDILDNLKADLSSTYNVDVVINKDIKFEQTHVKDDLITSSVQLRENMKSKMSFLVSGYVLLVNNQEIGALKTEKEVKNIIEKIKEPYISKVEENSKIKEVKILEDVQIVKKDVLLNKMKSSEELLKYIETGSEEIKTHMVEVGESLWTIAKIYNMSVDDLIAANQDKNPEKLYPGDEIKLVVPKSMLTVATIEEVEYTENINYDVKIEYNEKMYKNEKKVKVEGAKGKNQILANVIKHNGVLVEKEIIKEEIVEKPIDEVVVRGTKEVPKTVATGSFLMPTRGSISSRYGMRNGRMHKGLDIAAKVGTPIKAADGGKVVFSGYKGNFGYMVEVDHGNGYKTRYAHCSKLLVKVGDKVYKGQHIANVGNTGRSTGPHLHLEILKNGTNQNPIKYVN